MKKVITILLTIIIISTLFVGCSSKPDDISQEMYEYGIEALNVADDYLNGEITISAAESELNTIKEKSSAISKDIDYSSNYKYKNDVLVNSSINSLYFEISTGSFLDNISNEDIQEKRDSLSKCLKD